MTSTLQTMSNPEVGSMADIRRSEILLFSIGSKETFGINVFRVREVCRTPNITRAPNTRHGIEGFISLRGSLIPVINPAKIMGINVDSSGSQLVVTEVNGRTRAFMVDSVAEIIRVNWSEIQPAESVVAEDNSRMLSAVTKLHDGRLVSIIDVETIIYSAIGEQTQEVVARLSRIPEQSVFFADDSSVARKKIANTLERMGLKFQSSMSGNSAWSALQDLAMRAKQDGKLVKDRVFLIMIDGEMSDLDGYALCARIKADRAFAGIPVAIHSSLSSEPNKKLANEAGADAIVAPFSVTSIAETVSPFSPR